MSSSTTAKRVSFSDGADQTVEVPSHVDYSDAEYSATWRTEDEEKASETEIVKTLQIARGHNGSIPQDLEKAEQMTTRGIEAICSQALYQQLSTSKDLCIASVIRAQSTQIKQTGDASPHRINDNRQEIIKRASLAHSAGASNNAITRGAMDAAFVRRISKAA